MLMTPFDSINAETARRQQAIERATAPLRAELALVDPAAWITLIETGAFANIDDLVASSAEQHFTSGSVGFGLGADYALGWSRAPRVDLDMEFNAGGVTAFFTVVLGDGAGVQINRILFSDADAAPPANTTRLVAALEAARRPPAR